MSNGFNDISTEVTSANDLDTDDHSHDDGGSKCVASDVTQYIQKYVSTAYMKTETKRELHYILPYEEAKKGNFEKLFQVWDPVCIDLSAKYKILSAFCSFKQILRSWT